MNCFTCVIAENYQGASVQKVAKQLLCLSTREFTAAKFHGKIQVNGVDVYSTHVLKTGDSLLIQTPERQTQTYEPLYMPLHIPYEDDHLLIVDKPAHLPAVPTPKKDTPTLANAIYAHMNCPSHFVYRAINRLDKGTSGLMLLAKSAHLQQRLQKQLHTPDFCREYLALVEGRFPYTTGTVYAPIAKKAGATIQRMVQAGGKEAVTHFRCVKVGPKRSLVALKLQTGRTHQIRVHMSYLGFPLVGDFCYGTEIEALPMRFALHSARLCVIHPITQEKLDVVSPAPTEWQRLLESEE